MDNKWLGIFVVAGVVIYFVFGFCLKVGVGREVLGQENVEKIRMNGLSLGHE